MQQKNKKFAKNANEIEKGEADMNKVFIAFLLIGIVFVFGCAQPANPPAPPAPSDDTDDSLPPLPPTDDYQAGDEIADDIPPIPADLQGMDDAQNNADELGDMLDQQASEDASANDASDTTDVDETVFAQ